MKCLNCGKTIKDNNLFCPFCGKMPSIVHENGDDEPILQRHTIIPNKFISTAPIFLTVLGCANIILWFVKTVVLRLFTAEQKYDVQFPLSMLYRNFTVVAVILCVVAVSVRVLAFIKGQNFDKRLYFLSIAADVCSLACLFWKFATMASIDVGETIAQASVSLTAAGWILAAVCLLSLGIHMILIFANRSQPEK